MDRDSDERDCQMLAVMELLTVNSCISILFGVNVFILSILCVIFVSEIIWVYTCYGLGDHSAEIVVPKNPSRQG